MTSPIDPTLYELRTQSTYLTTQNNLLADVKTALTSDGSVLGKVAANEAATNTNLASVVKNTTDQITRLNTIDARLSTLTNVVRQAPTLAINARGPDVAVVHAGLTKIGLAIPKPELDNQTFGTGTREMLSYFQASRGLPGTGIVDDLTRAALTIATSQADVGTQRVEGRLVFDHGAAAKNVTLRLYTRGFGGTLTKLGNDVTSDDRGFYSVPYTRPANPALPVHIEVHAVGSDGKEIALSATRFNAGAVEVANLVVPGNVKPLDSEHARLTGDLAAQLGGNLGVLPDAREDDDHDDLSLLHRNTGWDARLITCVASAVRLSRDTKISQDTLYALLRAGAPDDRDVLVRMRPELVAGVLRKAQQAGIIAMTDDQITAARAEFEAFAKTTWRSTVHPAALSTMGEMLNRSTVTDTATLDERTRFENVYFTHRGTPQELWQRAQDAGVTHAKIDALKVQGKLAYLTVNNARLTESLLPFFNVTPAAGAVASPSPKLMAKLADGDYDVPARWEAVIRQIAGPDPAALAALIPPAYLGKDVNERLSAYSADLARKVRVSFPTKCVARMIARGTLRLRDGLRDVHVQLLAPVSRFLSFAESIMQQEGKHFEFGRQSLGAFLKKNEAGIAAFVPASQKADTIKQLKRLQRLYQLTPSNEAMVALSNIGFDSAHDVIAMPRDVFLARHGARFPTIAQAELVYSKAEQIAAATYGFFMGAVQLTSTADVAATSPPRAIREQTRAALCGQLPTLDNLFGSLDFCECEHCRSVLSPAAYFVDLLEFLNPAEWNAITASWSATHNGAPYTKMKPYDALVALRPDLPYLALTCENTNTALPYIDIVNEILEYRVVKDVTGLVYANNTMDPRTVHDTGSATSDELLAEPQYVSTVAYDALKQQTYPLALPFDLYTETVRGFLDYFDTPLWTVLDALRASDDLDGGAGQIGKRAVFREYLRLTANDEELFTSKNTVTNWFALYGYNSAAEALPALTNAKTLSKRLGITYKELIEVVKTGFVNPKLDGLELLRRLRMDMADVLRYLKPNPPLATADAARDLERQAIDARLAQLDRDVDAYRKQLQQLDREYVPPTAFKASDRLAQDFANHVYDGVLLVATSAACDFDGATLKYSDDANVIDGRELLRINLFVRLWKKLGWTIEETDRALCTFLPEKFLSAPTIALPAALSLCMPTALLYLSHLQALQERATLGKDGRMKLLTLWRTIPTQGKRSLYAKLFLTRAILKDDPSFDDPAGDYLNNGLKIRNHTAALQSALNIDAEDIRRILVAAGQDPDESILDLATVSLVHRHAVLAKVTRLSVKELLCLRRLSGVDPFASIVTGGIDAIVDDKPYSNTIRFVDLSTCVRESGLTLEDLDYLLRHRVWDADGQYRSSTADETKAFIKSVDVADIESMLDVIATSVAADRELSDALLKDRTLVSDPSRPEATLLDALTSKDPARVERARVLLTKIVRITRALAMTEGELRYIVGHAGEFGFDLNKIPSRDASDDEAAAFDAVATSLFNGFEKVARYAALRRDMAGDGTGVIDIMGAAGEANRHIANVARRDLATVEGAISVLPVAPDLATREGVSRVWRVLQLIQQFGIGPDALKRWASPAPDATVAADVKQTLKSRFEPDEWQRVAQSVYDRLRKRQRDALVAYMLNRLSKERVEELFDVLLLDPGMEPVVRTSRVRQAIASVQLFVNRCLMNLVPNVDPTVINTRHWSWMKKYRVWEANRKIFLYPENWLEPEFRDDKTHLYQQLESTLLQDDVTNDVAEGAFFTYLKGLEQIARLELVAMYCEENVVKPNEGAIHVVGRTHSLPRKYFYRSYKNLEWTPWQPVDAEIEGDHIAAVVWRGRLHLFWVTFMEKAKEGPQDRSFKDLADESPSSIARKEIQLQLNWCEYFQGEWTSREGGGFSAPDAVEVATTFSPSDVSMHVSKDYDGPEERGVKVHLHIDNAILLVPAGGRYGGAIFDNYVLEVASGAANGMVSKGAMTMYDKMYELRRRTASASRAGGAGSWKHAARQQELREFLQIPERPYLIRQTGTRNCAFYIRSKLVPPTFAAGASSRPSPYSTEPAAGTVEVGRSGRFEVSFNAAIETDVESNVKRTTPTTLALFGQVPPHTVLVNSDPLERPTEEIGSLTSPFFYQDDEHAFFIMPTLSETTIEHWEDWIIKEWTPAPQFDDDWLNDLTFQRQVPQLGPPPPIDPRALFTVDIKRDWVTDPLTTIPFGGRWIGASGGVAPDRLAAAGAPREVEPRADEPVRASYSTPAFNLATSAAIR